MDDDDKMNASTQMVVGFCGCIYTLVAIGAAIYCFVLLFMALINPDSGLSGSMITLLFVFLLLWCGTLFNDMFKSIKNYVISIKDNWDAPDDGNLFKRFAKKLLEDNDKKDFSDGGELLCVGVFFFFILVGCAGDFFGFILAAIVLIRQIHRFSQ